MYRKQVKRTSSVAALAAALLLAFWPGSGWSQPKERVTMQNKWVYAADVAPIFLGLKKGYFAAEGIDLDFQDGRGSGASLQLLGAKKVPFALADLSLAAKFISEGMAIKAVWAYTQVTPMAVIYREGLGIRNPKDLEGKKVGTAAASPSKTLFDGVAKVSGVDLSKVQFVVTTAAGLNTSLLNRDTDAIITYWTDNVGVIRSKGAKVGFLPYADYGVNVFGAGISVHESVLKEKPDTIRRLLRAMSRSVEDSRKNPGEAIAALQERAPLSIKDPRIGREGLESILTLLHTKNSQGKPLGWMAREDWQQTVETMAKYSGLKNPLPPERYYTNDFIPSM